MNRPTSSAVTALVEAHAETSSPYVGLTPYKEENVDFFFGRDQEREIIVANLLASRLTLLYGESGVGKTSVLRAGVAHDLRMLAEHNIAHAGTPELAVVVFDSWRDDPVPGILGHAAQALDYALGSSRTLAPGSGSLASTFEAWTNILGGDLLIILDQFEEYLLYHGREDGEGTFAWELPRVLRRPDLRVNLLISIREDALAKLDRFKGRIPNLFNNYVRIDYLDRSGGRAAIEKPLDRFNELRPSEAVSIEPALVDAVLDQVRTGRVVFGSLGAGGPDSGSFDSRERIETPYLQLVMTRLWEEEIERGSRVLRRETLSRLGEAEKIIGLHLDDIMNGLTQDEREMAARAFHHLVTPSGTKIAHAAADLAVWGGIPTGKVTSLLTKLAEPKLRIMRTVPSSPDDSSGRFEIFHDALVPAVLDWRHRYIESRAARRRHRRWWLASVVVAVLLGLGGWSLAQTRSIIQRPDLIVAELNPGPTLIIRNVGKSPSGTFRVQLEKAKQTIAQQEIGHLEQEDDEPLRFDCVEGAVEAIVDSGDQISESNEANNTRWARLGCADLTAAVASESGKLLVKNVGTAPAGPFVVRIGDIPAFVSGLGPGDTFRGLERARRIACEAEPSRDVSIEVDPEHSVLERDEENNELVLRCGPSLRSEPSNPLNLLCVRDARIPNTR